MIFVLIQQFLNRLHLLQVHQLKSHITFFIHRIIFLNRLIHHLHFLFDSFLISKLILLKIIVWRRLQPIQICQIIPTNSSFDETTSACLYVSWSFDAVETFVHVLFLLVIDFIWFEEVGIFCFSRLHFHYAVAADRSKTLKHIIKW